MTFGGELHVKTQTMERLWRGGKWHRNVNCIWKSWGDEQMGWQVTREMQLWWPFLPNSTSDLYFIFSHSTFWPPFWELNLKLSPADLFSTYHKGLLILESKVINVFFKLQNVRDIHTQKGWKAKNVRAFPLKWKYFPSSYKDLEL